MSDSQHAAGLPVPDAAEPSLAERARTLAAIAGLGCLSTHSRKIAGFPFGSMMPFAADNQGRPVFFISSLAVHTQNIAADPRASLFIAQPDVADDPLAAARLTIVGRASVCPPDEVRDLYLGRHENAKYWQDFTDFAYYRLEVEAVYYVGGFGVMGWVSPPAYAAAAPDPLASVSSELIENINREHAAELRRFASHSAGEPADEGTITALDRLGFHLRVRCGGRVHGRRFAFPREARDAESARLAVLELCAAAERETL